MSNAEDTQPNTTRDRARAALKTANAAADPVIDRLLLRVMASGWTTAIVGGTLLAALLVGFVLGVRWK